MLSGIGKRRPFCNFDSVYFLEYMKKIKIKNKFIGDNYPIFFIAEAGVNHNGSMKYAKKLIDIAKTSGADAVKFQSFITEEIILPNAPKSTYHIETTGPNKKQTWMELLKTQEISKPMLKELIKYSNITSGTSSRPADRGDFMGEVATLDCEPSDVTGEARAVWLCQFGLRNF